MGWLLAAAAGSLVRQESWTAAGVVALAWIIYSYSLAPPGAAWRGLAVGRAVNP